MILSLQINSQTAWVRSGCGGGLCQERLWRGLCAKDCFQVQIRHASHECCWSDAAGAADKSEKTPERTLGFMVCVLQGPVKCALRIGLYSRPLV